MTRLNTSSVSPAPTRVAVSRNRSNCGFSPAAGGLRAGISLSIGHLPTSRSVSKALTNDTLQRAVCAFDIIHAKTDASVIPEVKLGHVAVKMVLAAVLIGALHAALEDTKIALAGVGVDVAPRPLEVAMDDHLVLGNVVAGEALLHLTVLAAYTIGGVIIARALLIKRLVN